MNTAIANAANSGSQSEVSFATNVLSKQTGRKISPPAYGEHSQVEVAKLQDRSREEIRRNAEFDDIVGNSATLRRVLDLVQKVAAWDSSVLLLGETGTGKELIAQAIHRHSSRSQRRLIKVNCAALPSELVASELFGHEKGAFTGAMQQRIGRFEAANGGTIFIDEIAELNPDMQVALLRVLQEKEFERVGGNRTIKTDVRVIAATNRDLWHEVSVGRFRMDLFYRLNVFPIHVPPLRERVEDIPALVNHFAGRLASQTGKTISCIEQESLAGMRQYSWPGNIRELQNVIERCVILAADEVLRIPPGMLAFDSSRGFDPPASVGTRSNRKAEIEAVLRAPVAKFMDHRAQRLA